MRPEREPPELRAVQDGLFALITGRPPAAAASAAAESSAEALVESDAGAGAAERVHVYAHMYRARIAEALESQFPRLARGLGAEAMAELAFAYVSDHPSRHPSLRWLGQRLPAWLEANRPALPWLAELAHLEWARADVFDAPDQPLLSLDAVRAWPPDQLAALPVQTVAAHRLVTTDHAIADLWDRLGAGAPLDAPARARESLLVWRQDVSVFHRTVDEPQRAALELAAKGTTFGTLCDRLAARLSEEAAIAEAFRWLSTWLADELLLSSSPSPSSSPI